MTDIIKNDSKDLPDCIKVRFSELDDVEKIMDFYADNPHPAYAPRNSTPKRVKNGYALLIEEQDGTVLACSVEYNISKEAEKPDIHTWSELGTTQIVLNGCNLYPFIVAAQALMAYFENAPRKYIYADIHKTHKAVIHLLNGRLKWPKFEPPEDLIKKCKESLAADKKDIPVNFYKCGEEQLPHQAVTVLNVIENGGVEHKSGEKIEMDFSDFILYTDYLEEIKDLAAHTKDSAFFCDETLAFIPDSEKIKDVLARAA